MDEVESLMEDEEEVDNDSEETSSPNNLNGLSSASLIRSTPNLPSLTDPLLHNLVREIGQDAVWSLSTAKPGNGVEQIRDSSMDTYWQSDGGQPHLINIQFSKRASVCEVAFCLDYNLDESYTPRKISVRAGMTFHDLEEVRVIDLNEPNGWVSVPLVRRMDHLELEEEDEENLLNKENGNDSEELNTAIRRPIRAHFIQICVVAMHQNGRDTHIRQVKVFGPRSEVSGRRGGKIRENTFGFTTVEMSQFDSIR